jgi:hypothetical protein
MGFATPKGVAGTDRRPVGCEFAVGGLWGSEVDLAGVSMREGGGGLARGWRPC